MQCISANASNLVIKRIITSFQCVDIVSITQFDIKKNLHDAEEMTFIYINALRMLLYVEVVLGSPLKERPRK